MSAIDRIPPNNLEAEMAVLGACLIDREMIPLAMAHVKAEDFYAHVHETIFLAIVELFNADQPVDKITLAEALQRRDRLERVGGLPYLNKLMDTVPTAASMDYYAQVVADKAGSRNILKLGHDLIAKAYDEYFESSAALQDYGIREMGRALSSSAVMVSSLEQVLETVVNRIGTPGQAPFLTQWQRLDALTGGFKPGELVVWGAAPGMGKSIGVGNLAEFTAFAYAPAGFLLFSLEMQQEDTAERILSMRSGVPVRKIREGTNLTEEDWRALTLAQKALSGHPLDFVTRHPRRSLADIKRSARQQYQRRERLSGIAIDHIGFVSDLAAATAKIGGSKHHALDSLIAELLDLGDELRCPVHVVYHLNRGAKADKPTIFDLRDGGNTEGHATTVIFPWRANPDNSPAKVDDNGEFIPPTRGEFIVAKCRHGVTGTVPMYFDGVESMWLEASDPRPWFEKPERT